LDELAAAYGLESMDFDELLNRLEIVPPSLAIAQAAAESGWGTSRFAHQGNALFGQRVWGEGGLAPLKREAADGVKVRAFDDLLDAVRSYTFNLNSHEAYAEFREWRTKLRRAGRPLSGLQLASHLRRYSEQGPEYVKFIETLIRTNGLEAFDGARLGPTAVLQTASGV
jgi:Bax protein